jgi:hypothetical protein
MDKSIYQAPLGIADIENPDQIVEEVDFEVEGEDDGMEEERDFSIDIAHDDNLVDVLPEEKITRVRSDLMVDIDNDLLTRKEWEETLIEGMALLGMRYEDMNEPWEGACGVYHPVIGEATVRFQSETVMETFPAAGPVKTQVLGVQTPEKLQAAHRVKADMNYQLTEVMPEYRNEHERMLFTLAPMGCAFKKIYYDPTLGRPVSIFVPPEDIVLPYGASHLPTAPRVTHRMRKTKNDLLKLMEAGFYREFDLTGPTIQRDEIKEAKDAETGLSEQEPELYTLYECHCELALEEGEDEIARPYIVTILVDTDQVLAIRRNWLEEDILKLPRQHFVKYDYVPGFGPYGFGLIHLIGGFAKAGTSILRQLVDAGTWSNMQGGFKSTGTRIRQEDTKVSPGTYLDIDIPGTDIRQHIMQVETKEPSAVLAQLMEKILEDARRYAATADMDISDISAQTPVGTTMALLERMLKVMSAVQARVHFSFKQELKLLAGIIRDYAPDEYDYDPESADRTARKVDYETTEIIPVSDPNASTMSQRIVLWQAVLQLSADAPNIYDKRELHRAMLEVFGVPNINKLVPMPPELQPQDPVSENMGFLVGKPTKAFIHQDHNAHLQVHNNMLQDPMIQMQIGQNPQAQMITGGLMAHIAEHLAFQYRAQIEQNLGVPLPAPGEPMPPEMEVAIAPLIAEASKMLLSQSQIAAVQMEQQQLGADPSNAVEMEKIKVKREEIEHKKQDSQRDYDIAQQKLQLERDRLQKDARSDGLKIGVDLVKAKSQQQHQSQMAQENNKFAARKGMFDHATKTEQQRQQLDFAAKKEVAGHVSKNMQQDKQLSSAERSAERQAAQRAEESKQKQAAQKKAKPKKKVAE